jgi:hypothetical protein
LANAQLQIGFALRKDHANGWFTDLIQHNRQKQTLNGFAVFSTISVQIIANPRALGSNASGESRDFGIFSAAAGGGYP